MDTVLIGSALAGFSLFLLFLGAFFFFRSRSAEIEKRVGQLPLPPLPNMAGVSSVRAKPGLMSRLLATGAAPDLATEMARADLRLSPAEWVLISFTIMVAGFVVGFLVFHQNLIVTIVGGALGLFAPRWYLRYLQRKRLTAFEKQLGDTITLLSNSLRTGYSLLQSVETVSRELAAPASLEFTRVVREVGLGLTLPEALENLLRRVPSDDLDFIITAIKIQYEVGGNLAQVLDSIAQTIRERVRVLGEIRVLTTQQRMSAIVLTILPPISGLLMFLVNPDYMSQLWETACGLQMVGTGAVLMVIGFFVIQRIANIRV